MTNNSQNRFGKKIMSHQLNFFLRRIADFSDREKKKIDFSKLVGSLSYPVLLKNPRQNLSWWNYCDMKKGTGELCSENTTKSSWSKWENISNYVLNGFSSVSHYFHQWHYYRVYLFHLFQMANWKQLEELWWTVFRIQNNWQIGYLACKIPKVWLDVDKCNNLRIEQ